jgi:hypothetical protein
MRAFIRVAGWACVCLGAAAVTTAQPAFTGKFTSSAIVGSTLPANGDENPYGVAVVPRSTGALTQNDILVSNFNNSGNLQGTGTTIDEISPDGKLTLFAAIPKDLNDCPGGVGLTTALVVLRAGWVIVGSLPTTDGMADTINAGCLIVLNRWGKPVKTFAGDGINGPWDMTALDLGKAAVLFVTNVLNQTVAAGGSVVKHGTVLRIVLAMRDDEDEEEGAPRILARTVIASRFSERTDPNALVIGPTGVGLGLNGTLYVADSAANRIAAIPDALFRFSDAGEGNTVTAGNHLNGPLGLAIAPNGNILTVNSGDGNLVETTPGGTQVAVKGVDTSGAGAGSLFGLALAPGGHGVYFVDDGNNTLDLLH